MIELNPDPAGNGIVQGQLGQHCAHNLGCNGLGDDLDRWDEEFRDLSVPVAPSVQIFARRTCAKTWRRSRSQWIGSASGSEGDVPLEWTSYRFKISLNDSNPGLR